MSEIYQIISITVCRINDTDTQSVNARELHGFLESKQEFSHWIKNRIEDYDFTQSIDFIVIHNFIIDATAFGGKRKVIDYFLTLDTALSIVRRSKSSKQPEIYQFLSSLIKREVLIREQERKEVLFGRRLRAILNNIATIKTQYRVEQYRVDFYIPKYDILIEYDEKHHQSQLDSDVNRQEFIQRLEPASKIIRVKEGYEDEGINLILIEILKKAGM